VLGATLALEGEGAVSVIEHQESGALNLTPH